MLTLQLHKLNVKSDK